MIATPALQNTPFQRAVVLVLQNTIEGTFGVTLNRPANQEMRSAWEELTGSDSPATNIVQGGPIGGPVLALHQQSKIAEHQVAQDVFVSAASEDFMERIDLNDQDYRIVFGVAGWKNDQLAREIHDGYWYRLDQASDHIFDDAGNMWEESLRRYGRQALIDVAGVTGFPKSPLDN